jgi:hypothetical protein
METKAIPKNAPVTTIVNVTLPDAVGGLAAAARALATARIPVQGFSAGTGGARFVTSDPTRAVVALTAGGLHAEALPYWCVALEDPARQTAEIGEALAAAGVPIQDAFSVPGTVGDGTLYFRCGNPGATGPILDRWLKPKNRAPLRPGA